MDKEQRKKLTEAYRQIKVQMGVYQVKNTVNGKIYIDTNPNLKNRWLTLCGALDTKTHMNAALQADWNQYGADAFTYEVLEAVEPEDGMDTRWELKKMKAKWLDAIKPYGDSGYNRESEKLLK